VYLFPCVFYSHRTEALFFFSKKFGTGKPTSVRTCNCVQYSLRHLEGVLLHILWRPLSSHHSLNHWPWDQFEGRNINRKVERRIVGLNSICGFYPESVRIFVFRKIFDCHPDEIVPNLYYGHITELFRKIV